MTTTDDRPAVALETGWQQTTAIADTMLRRFVFNHADYIDAVVLSAGGRTMRTAGHACADLGRPAALYNSATLLQPLEPGSSGAVLDDIERFYGASGSGEVLLWSPFPTPDLHRRGWELMGHPPLLLRPPGLGLPPAPDVRIDQVGDRSALRIWERIVVEGFPFPGTAVPGTAVPKTATGRTGTFLSERLLADDRFDLWLAFDGDRPVTAAALFRAHGLAQFAFGVTLPDARRRGHWAALVRHRLRVAGDLPSAAIFNDNSRPGAERYGFWPLCRFTVWSRPRP